MTEAISARAAGICGDDPAASALYRELCAQVERRKGCVETTDAVRLMDYIRLEQLKARASEDIAARGLGRMENNGRQRYWKDNKSATLILKYMDQQSKILKALGLGGVDAGAEDGGDGDAGDDFDSI